MKLPNRHKLGTLTVLAILLAWMSTGSLSVCEAFFGIEPVTGPTVPVTLHAGDTVNDFTGLAEFFSRFAICNLVTGRATSAAVPAGVLTVVPAGVYTRCNRDLRGSEPTATVDLITSASTPPGHYMLEYRDTSPGSYVIGTLDLTVEASESNVTACLYALGEVFTVNTSIEFYACCSLSPDPENDPIVEYKWWYDYNSNPSQPPSATTTACITYHTYTTAGAKYTRLVVRTQSGLTAEDSHIYVVNAP